ncbi:MAG TPA: sulfotransferase domain-containing protein [Bauldia sp.]
MHRDPADVMISFWRFIQRWRWHEGPRAGDVLDFARSEPEGRMLRYQMKQRGSLLDRWAKHVEGWVEAAEGRDRLVVIRYDKLRDRYRDTISGLSDLLGQRPGDVLPPNRTTNVIQGVPADRLETPDTDALRQLALAEIGDTMRRLEYA